MLVNFRTPLHGARAEDAPFRHGVRKGPTSLFCRPVKHHSLLVAIVLASCGRKEAPKPVAPHVAHEEAPATGSAENAPETAPAPPPVPLVLQLHVERSVDGVGLRVIHGGEGPVELAQEVVLERAQGDAWEALPHKLHLRLTCQEQGCITLAPGAELTAPPWLGSASGERCDALLPRPPAGTYRLVVRSCDGRARSDVSFVELNE